MIDLSCILDRRRQTIRNERRRKEFTMTLPIYISDPSGRQGRSEKDHNYITQFMHDTVTNAVAAAGFTPVKKAAPDMVQEGANLEGFGGLILFGGYDVDSAYYRGANRSKYRFSRGDATDEYELELIYAALRAGIPILGICRGMQLINVAFGGSLHADIGHMAKVKHNNFGAGAYEHRAVAHDVEVVRSSVLADGVYSVASSHHQSVKALGEKLEITAYSTDGIVEMIEAAELNVIGTQWHPEASHVDQDDTITPLIANFLKQVPAQHTAPASSLLPSLMSAEDLLARFPVPAPSSYVSGPPMALFEDGNRWDEDESIYGGSDIIGRHYFLDESDYTLQDDMDAERFLEDETYLTDSEYREALEREAFELEKSIEQERYRELWF